MDEIPLNPDTRLTAVHARSSTGLEVEDCDDVRRVDQGFELGSLVGGKQSRFRTLGQGIDLRLNGWIESKFADVPRYFVIETAAQAVQQAMQALCKLYLAHSLIVSLLG